MVRPTYVPHGDKPLERSRPGWKASPPIVCYTCFEKQKHVSPDCAQDPLDFALIVRNYEALTPAERQGVPTGAYQLAKRCLAASKPAANTEKAGPKN